MRLARLLAVALTLAGATLWVTRADAESLTVLLPAEFPSLDPGTITSGDQLMVMYHVYCRLYTFNDDMEPLSDLVTQEGLSADKRTWTFKIKRGVKFHDGTPVNADAVKYTLERLHKKGGSAQVLLPAISEIRVEGDDTVIVTTQKPFPSLRSSLAHPNAGLVSAKADAQMGERYGSQPVSCGPYVAKEWTRGTRIVVARFDGYSGPRPAYDQIVFQFVSEVTTRLFMMQRGQADIALRLGPQEARQLEGSKVKAVRVDGRNIFYEFNFALPPTNDLRVRQAINHAVDKTAIIQRVLQGAGVPARSVLEKMVWAHVPVGTYAYDPEKARRLLKEANAVNARIVLMSPDNRYLLDSQVSQAVAGYLKAVGLNVDLQVIGDWPGFIDTIKKRQFNLFMLGWAASTGDPDLVLQTLFHSRRAGQLWNLGSYVDKETDRLIDAGASTFDSNERRRIYAGLQKRLFEEAPWLFMYRVTSFTGVSEKVKELHTLEGPEFHFVFPLPR